MSNVNAFIEEMREFNSKNDHMIDVYNETINLIGTNETIAIRDRFMKSVYDAPSIWEGTGIPFYLIRAIHDDIRMMNVSIHHHDGGSEFDSYTMFDINNESMSVDDAMSALFDSYFFIFVDDNDYAQMISCTSDHNYDVDDDCDCVSLVFKSYMNAKRHAIDGANSSDVYSATLVGTRAMRDEMERNNS